MITLESIFDWIREKRPFALARYGDGELRIMRGQSVPVSQDGWTAPEGASKLGALLLESFRSPPPGFVRGIPGCSNCCWEWGRELFELSTEKNDTDTTCACLFIHERYQVVKDFIRSLREPVVLVANERSSLTHFPPALPIERFFGVPLDPIGFTDSHRYQEILGEVAARSSSLVLLSCGPAANALAYEAWKRNPTNRYVDLGSALDEFVHGRVTRPYISVTDWEGRGCRFGNVELFSRER